MHREPIVRGHASYNMSAPFVVDLIPGQPAERGAWVGKNGVEAAQVLQSSEKAPVQLTWQCWFKDYPKVTDACYLLDGFKLGFWFPVMRLDHEKG